MFTATFLLERAGGLEIFYAPMEWLRPTARIAIVGITPGRGTTLIAYQTAVDGLATGRSPAAILNAVKSKAAFSGFRDLLTDWLHYLGVQHHLGLSSAHELWTPRGQNYLHSTSTVRYPVLKDGENYGGNPSMTRHPLLRRYVSELLGPELAKIPAALILPLGINVGQALELLVEEGRLDLDRCLIGFPHPSGVNASRTAQWTSIRTALRRKLNAWFAAHPVV